MNLQTFIKTEIYMNNRPKNNALHIPKSRCHQAAQEGDVSLASLELEATEYSILSAARFFFSSFANPETPSWMTVVIASEDFFPVKDSARIVQSILIVIHEVRVSRKSTLRFSNPHCVDCQNNVTAEERHFISMVRKMNSNRPEAAVTHAMLLCEGNQTTNLLVSVGHLIKLLATNDLKISLNSEV